MELGPHEFCFCGVVVPFLYFKSDLCSTLVSNKEKGGESEDEFNRVEGFT